jgi:hypothetical protein
MTNRIVCEDCEGSGLQGEAYGGNEFQPPERDDCTSCGGTGYWGCDEPPAPLATDDELLALLPGTYYMDPPDGGSVTVLEQLQRMAADAARYRQQLAAPSQPFWTIVQPGEAAQRATHQLKILPAYFADVYHGLKTFEIRKDDRGFCIGDLLVLNEYDQFTNQPTGRSLTQRIRYIIRDPAFCKEGFCIMSIEPVTKEQTK